MKTRSNARKARLNLELDPAVRRSLDDLQEKSGASSLTEAIRRALALYDMVIDHSARGGKLILRDAEGQDEVVRIL
jgi:hypothetical protein